MDAPLATAMVEAAMRVPKVTAIVNIRVTVSGSVKVRSGSGLGLG